MHFKVLAAPFTKAVKITEIKTLSLDNTGDGCILNIEMDAGVVCPLRSPKPPRETLRFICAYPLSGSGAFVEISLIGSTLMDGTA